MVNLFPAAEVEGSVPARFARVAASRADALAIVAEGERLTYGELARRSDALAAAIADTGGTLEAPVAVYAPAPAATILAMLATWKAGRFCVPLDPTLPPARLEEILRDADAGLVVAGGEAAFDVGGRRVLRIDTLDLDAAASPPAPAITADSLACLLYTSGSTGEPKGVVRTHRNLLHRARCAVDSLGIGVEDRVSALHSPAFGAGLRDVLAALLGGATLLPFDVRRAGLAALADWIARERITVLCAVVTTLRHFLGSLDADRRFPSIRIVRLGSEALFREDVERLRARLAPDCVLVAGYGASEASGIVEFRIGPDADLPPGRVPAGYPLEGVEILILGEAGTPLPEGEAGEIAVRSRYLSPGYWRRPDRTRALFLGEAIGDAPRVYRTGDLGRLGPDGCLELIGRLDHQVKIRGYLVHPDEIERRLLEHGEIRQAAVLGLDDGGGATRLVAYVVPSQGSAPAPAALRRFLQERLPDYMLPATFVSLDALPLTPSGKIDRAALPAPAEAARAATFVRPRNPLEHQIAALWEELFDCRPIGATDDFFDLGGNSLLAAAFVARLQHVHGRVVPPSALLEASTVGAVAALLLRSGASPASPLVALRDTGSRPPLFFLHGDYNGGGMYCHALVRRLHPDRPMYVLSPHGVDGTPIPATIEDMAVDHLGALRAARPHGPYALAGWCNGGLVALEMARRLRAEGERVGVAVLIDADAPLRGFHLLRWALDAVGRTPGLPASTRDRLHARIEARVDRLAGLARYYDARLEAWQAASLASKMRRGARSVGRTARQLVSGRATSPTMSRPRADDDAQSLPRQRSRVYHASFQRYHPAPYEGFAVVIRSENRPGFRSDLGWSRILPRREIVVIPGGHLSAITRHVDALAARLDSALRQGDDLA